MSGNISHVNKAFLDLCKNIDREVNDISRDIATLPDEKLTSENYLQITNHFDYIQALFDDASVIMKDLTLDQNNPDLYALLEHKAGLNELYGLFHRVRGALTKRFENLHGKGLTQEKERTRERVLESVPDEEEVPVEADEPVPEDDLLDDDFIGEDNDWAKRQEHLADKARAKEARRYGELRDREEAAARLGMNINPNASISEAELRNERLRQDDLRMQEAQALRERNERQQAMFAEHRQRMEQLEHFEGLDKGHFDYSIYSGVQSDSVFSDPANYMPAAVAVTENKALYSWLKSPEYAPAAAQEGKPLAVPAYVEQQMRTNVEAARLDYEAAKGSDREPAAQQRYLQERATYEDFRQEVKSERFVIAEPAQPAFRRGEAVYPVPNKMPEHQPAEYPQYSYGAPTPFVSVTENKELYNWIKSPEYAPAAQTEGKPLAVSSYVEQQMRTNVETARLEYEAAKGTEREPAAKQRYLQERTVYEDFRQEVKSERFVIAEPTQPAFRRGEVVYPAPNKMPEHQPAEYPQYSYGAPASSVSITKNKELFSWLKSPEYAPAAAQDGKPLAVPAYIEQQMRTNVEAARLDYEAAKGTEREPAAKQRYLQESSIYEGFRQEIKHDRIQIAEGPWPSFHKETMGHGVVVQAPVGPQAVPAGSGPVPGATMPAAFASRLSNQEIYNSLNSQERPSAAGDKQPVFVPAFAETQMRGNMEVARMNYEAARGTKGEAAAAQKYLQERTVYENFREKIKSGQFKLSEEAHTALPNKNTASQNPFFSIAAATGASPAATQKGHLIPVRNDSLKETTFVSYVPGGVESVAVKNGAVADPKLVRNGSGTVVQSPAAPNATVKTSVAGNDRIHASFGTSEHSDKPISNKDIYEWIKSSKSSDAGKSGSAIVVSSAFVQQMRLNVETAHMEYREARGTDKEKAAAHRYLQERNAFAQFRNEVKKQHFVVSDPTQPMPAPQRGKGGQKAVSDTPFQSAFMAFTPDGIEGGIVENGKLTKSSFSYHNPGLSVNVEFSPASPLAVHPDYEKKLHARMKSATSALNAIVASDGEGKRTVLPNAVSAEIKLSIQAYLGFQNAKSKGEVIISETAPYTAPDLRLWQQKYAAKSSGVNVSETIGSTGQYRGINPNKVTKGDVEEIASSVLKIKNPLKRQSVAGVYLSIIGSKFEGYVIGATLHLGRKFYQMLQEGEDNALRTLEKGRYYVATGFAVSYAIRHRHPVVTTAHSAARLSRKEFAKFGELTFLDKGQLSKQINEHRKAASALKKQIKELKAKGLLLTDEEQKQLLCLQSEHRSLSRQLRKEIGFTKYREGNNKMLKAAQDLKAKHHGFVTTKHVDAEIKRVQNLGQQKLVEKFGGLAAVTDKSLVKRIAELDKKNPLLKKQIKMLEAKGSALTAVERKKLKALIDQHKNNSLELRKLKGLLAARTELSDKVTALTKLRTQLQKNAHAWSSGFGVLHMLISKAVYEGSDLGSQGLLRGASIVTNRHVRQLVKRTMKVALKVGNFAVKATVEFIAPGTVQAVQAHATVAKAAVQAQVNAVKYQAKATIKTGVQATGKAIANATPERIKTAANSAGNAVKSVKKGINAAIDTVKNKFAQSAVGRGVAAANRAATATAEALQKVSAALKAFGAKAALIALGVFLVVGVISAFVTTIGGGASAIIYGDEIAGGKTSLMRYVEILEGYDDWWDHLIEANSTLGDFEEYYSVSIQYEGNKIYNYKEIISMMYVKLDYNLNVEEDVIKSCLRDLFYASHTYTSFESVQKCAGCKTKFVTHYEYCENPGRVCDETGERCQGHPQEPVEEIYCPGHLCLHVTKRVIGFDEIFRADDYGSGAGWAAGAFDATLGGVSAKYEAGGINPGKISSGAGDYGGKSYGTWQLSSNMGSVQAFVEWLGSGSYSTEHIQAIYSGLAGSEPGTARFDATWKNITSLYYDEFQELQAQYMYKHYCAPFIQRVYNIYGVDLSRSKALVELAFSTSVQFGPGATHVVGSINASMSDAEIIKTCYAYKRDNVDSLFRSSSEAIRRSLKNNRFVKEEQDLLSLVGVSDDNTENNDTSEDIFWTDEAIANVMFIYEQDWKALYDVYFDDVTGKPIPVT